MRTWNLLIQSMVLQIMGMKYYVQLKYFEMLSLVLCKFLVSKHVLDYAKEPYFLSYSNSNLKWSMNFFGHRYGSSTQLIWLCTLRDQAQIS